MLKHGRDHWKDYPSIIRRRLGYHEAGHVMALQGKLKTTEEHEAEAVAAAATVAALDNIVAFAWIMEGRAKAPIVHAEEDIQGEVLSLTRRRLSVPQSLITMSESNVGPETTEQMAPDWNDTADIMNEYRDFFDVDADGLSHGAVNDLLAGFELVNKLFEPLVVAYRKYSGSNASMDDLLPEDVRFELFNDMIRERVRLKLKHYEPHVHAIAEELFKNAYLSGERVHEILCSIKTTELMPGCAPDGTLLPDMRNVIKRVHEKLLKSIDREDFKKVVDQLRETGGSQFAEMWDLGVHAYRM